MRDAIVLVRFGRRFAAGKKPADHDRIVVQANEILAPGAIERHEDEPPGFDPCVGAHRPGTGKREQSTRVSWRNASNRRGSLRFFSASTMTRASAFISPSFMPRVVAAGVPRRTPEG